VFAIYSRQALEVLRQIAPYLRTHKRARAELLLQRYLAVTPRKGQYTTELLSARAAFETDFFAIRVRKSARGIAAGARRDSQSLPGNEHERSSAPASEANVHAQSGPPD
jgi:hypothetical protein